MTKTQDMWRVTAYAALLGCTALVSSCTTSSISTVGTTPSFAPTAALETISDNNSVEDSEPSFSSSNIDEQEDLAEDIVQKASNSIDAPGAATAAFSGDTITTQTVAAKPEVVPLTPADVLGTTEITTTENVAAAINPASDVLPAVEPAATAPKTAAQTGVFAFLKRNNEKRAEADAAKAAAKKEAEAVAAAAKSTRLNTKETAQTAKKQVTEMRALPGVRAASLFGISNGTTETTEPVQLASASIGAATRGAASDIATQTDRVSVDCFRPELIKTIKKIERHYGKEVVVTSGYRSPNKNRRAGGSSKSLHMYCAAADVQVEGVSKWALAKYIRSMPGRGGVGTYCHTNSVHVDIGSKRDWNWRCRRK